MKQFPSSRISIPPGKPVRRITIELDSKGQAAMAVQELPSGLSVMPFDMDAIILLQVAVTVLQTAQVQRAKERRGVIVADEETP